HRDAPNRILARPAGRHHPRARAAVSGRHRRRLGEAALLARAPMSVLAVSDLAKSFGGVRAVDGVSFTVGKGEFPRRSGPNGAGKSTCFIIIDGHLKPDAGRILFEGRDIAGLPPRTVWGLGVGRTFQIAAPFGSMTVAENVQMALISHAGETFRGWRPAAQRHRARAIALLAEVGMKGAAERASRELAYGDVKR